LLAVPLQFARRFDGFEKARGLGGSGPAPSRQGLFGCSGPAGWSGLAGQSADLNQPSQPVNKLLLQWNI